MCLVLTRCCSKLSCVLQTHVLFSTRLSRTRFHAQSETLKVFLCLSEIQSESQKHCALFNKELQCCLQGHSHCCVLKLLTCLPNSKYVSWGFSVRCLHDFHVFFLMSSQSLQKRRLSKLEKCKLPRDVNVFVCSYVTADWGSVHSYV